MIQNDKYLVKTSQGAISVWDSKANGPSMVLIHGNSACKEVFSKQMAALGEKYRLIAVDLPGHGKSENPKNTEEVYSFPGYATVITEVIKNLELKDPTILGWSLGGHIALELTKKVDGIKGILITGTPPISLTPEGIQSGFKPSEGMELIGKDSFTKEEAKKFMQAGGFDVNECQFLVDAAFRTDGLARKLMIASVGQGVGEDEKKLVAELRTPLAIIAGEKDPGINNEYIMGLKYGSLWTNEVKVIKGACHAAFWEKADEFNAVVEKFLESINS